MAQRLKDLGLTIDLILTSPFLRARQTAEILLAEGLSDRLQESLPLAPGGDLHQWMTWAQTCPETTLALVGHEPDLGEWVEQLVWGEPRQRLVVKKAGILGIQVPEQGTWLGNSNLFWLCPPRFLL